MTVLAVALSSACANQAQPGPADCEPYECTPWLMCAQGQATRTGLGELPCGIEPSASACVVARADCTAGCALEISTNGLRFGDLDPAVLCAETPAAAPGDPCVDDCKPTRAEIAPDGTVTQQYLACANDRCAPAAAPTIDRYLTPCVGASTKIAPGASGVIYGWCLVAWQGDTMVSGLTQTCAGDWECPEGSLCDDQLPAIGATQLADAVCKPGGPRGVIDPAKLHP